MNLRFQTAVGLLAAGLAAWVASVDAQQAPPVPAAIVLNGITTIFGDNRACFRVIFTGGLQEVDFMMAEGQARYGIRLLAVDSKLNTATISNQGLARTIPICKTPVLLARAASGGGAVASGKTDASYNTEAVASGAAQTSGNETQRGDGGQFARPGYAVGAAGDQPGSSQPGSSSSNNDASGNGATAANDSNAGASTSFSDNTTQEYHWWAKEAQKVELARQATAQQVMDGTMQPFPLTPFTPSGIPGQLVGTNRMFFTFDPLAANN